MLEVEPGVMIDLDMREVLDRPDEQGRAAKGQRILDLFPAVTRDTDNSLRVDGDHATRLMVGVNVEQHDQATGLGGGRAGQAEPE